MQKYKKASPIITRRNLAPPYYNYRFFTYCHLFPFVPLANGFHLSNAWWLMEASLLAYGAKQLITGCLHNAGMKAVRCISGARSSCFIAHNEQTVLLAFNGIPERVYHQPALYTQKLFAPQLRTNRKAVPSPSKGLVHAGFQDQLEEIWPDIRAYLSSIQTENRALWITGHGIGGALADLAAGRWKNVQGLYTFGSPPAGDPIQADSLPGNTFRIVNQNDMIPNLLPRDPFHHGGRLLTIRSDGSISELSSGGKLSAGSGKRPLFPGIRNYLKFSLFKQIPEGLQDHVPIVYAVRIWNHLLDREDSSPINIYPAITEASAQSAFG